MIAVKFKKFDSPKTSQTNKNWMYGMGILFIVMAGIIALRNLYLITTRYSIDMYLDNYINGKITNEKFVIAMVIAGVVLIYWGYFKKNKDKYKYKSQFHGEI